MEYYNLYKAGILAETGIKTFFKLAEIVHVTWQVHEY